jgi:transcriptional regulator with XRE-family HTH domain
MAGPSATLRAQWLGQQMREMRERANLTLKDVGDYVNRNASTVSRLEAGMPPPRVPEVLAYLDVCGIDDPQRRDSLRAMARDVWQKGWWDGFAGDVAGSLIDWIWLENRAVEIWSFQAIVLPGLLQTREYAEALIRTANFDATPEQIERFVEARMARKQLLSRDDDPVALFAIVDEAVLRRTVGGPEVMRAQLEHLREVAAGDHVTLMILPADAGAHASPDGSFDIFLMAPPYPDAACLSTPAGTLVVETDDAARLTAAYDRLRGQALGPGDSLAYLSDLVKRLE